MTIQHRNPLLTVDIIIKQGSKVILIKRKNPPYGWALPGGFVDYGESLEAAAVREAKEETGLDIKLIRQFHSYSDPKRDERFHTVTTVYIAEAEGIAIAGDDAVEVQAFDRSELPQEIAFDHKDILKDYFDEKY